MKSQNELSNEFNRREFLSTLTVAAGVLALGLAPGASAAEAYLFQSQGEGRRVGISDAAYRRARRRARALVKQMTLDEKISQLGSQVPAIERLNVPIYNYYTGEALHGLLHGPPVTSFPVPLALAAAWNPDLVHRVYTAVSDEARAYDNRDGIGLSYYSPATLNLHRDPRWGRCEEVPGEDPCLGGTVGVQMVRGMQGDNPNFLKTTACSKHFICNNTDDDRTWVSATVDPRSFWEYYTRAYRATILEGDVFTVMGAYSALNGIPCCASRFLMTDLLRHRWGFRGYVTSDCDAIDNIYDPHHYAASLSIASAMAVLAGCDLNCGGTLQGNLKAAVDQELISEEDIGVAVTRVFTVRYLLGLFDPPGKVPYTKIPFEVVDSSVHRALALEAARQSLVLLKNDSQFLPLNKAALAKVAVIGPTAGECHLGGYSGTPSVHISPYVGIAEALGSPIYNTHTHVWPDQLERVSEGVQTQPSSEGGTNVDWIGDGAWLEYKPQDFTGKNRIAIRVSSPGTGARVTVRIDALNGPKIAALNIPKTGDWQKWTTIDTSISGISGMHKVLFTFSGQGRAICNLEWFQLQPYAPPVIPEPQPGRPVVTYKPGCTIDGPKDEKMFGEAVGTARNADVVIMVCGVNQEVDREGHDRHTIGLTGAQPELIQAVFAANPKTVLVLSTNNSVAVNWEQEHLPAILCAVCAGQAQGKAIAEALFGEYNPGGKLPCTWYRSLDQLPPIHDYDIRKGRTYLYFDGDPLYPFGHGLSYTTFHLDHFKLEATTLGPGETVKISAEVTNTGGRAGAEVVQLYVTAPTSPVKRPIKQLVGFQRVELRPGEGKTVVFELPFNEQAFWYWDEEVRRFILQPGTAKIHVGNSSANLPLTAQLTLKAPANTQAEPDSLNCVAVKSRVV
jgi:beta-glucosidase